MQKQRKYRKLRGRIIEYFGTYKNFAAEIGKSVITLSAKLNGIRGLSQGDMILWGKLLEIEPKDYGLYFFDDIL